MNLWETLTSEASTSAKLHCWNQGSIVEASWSEVVRDAELTTAALRRAGVAPGVRVASILTNTPTAIRGILGVWLAGGAIASLPIPARGMDADEYAEQLTTLCDHVEASVFLVEERLLSLVPERVRERIAVRSWESLAGSGKVDPSPPGDDELAFIQYSSGSTSTPKGCMLTPRAITAQLELIMEMIDGRHGNEVTVSWLPLSHDMGFFGCLLTPWAYGFDLLLSPPERFMFSARSWFDDIAKVGATMTAGTNTALRLATRACRSSRWPEPLQLKVCIIGAERVQWDTLVSVSDTLGPHGLRSEALMPAYGLAEATLAATATPVGDTPRHVVVDAVALADGDVREVSADYPSATRIVSAGRPCRGVEIRDCGPDVLSEIVVRSPSLAAGYYGDPEKTASRFRHSGVLTGDLGFMRDGHLYPVGRLDDMISVGGRNVYACEIESAIDALEPVRPGCSTIIEDRAGKLTLLVELKRVLDEYRALARQAASVAMGKAAIALDACVLLERGSLPKTPSGKIQRHRCRHILEMGGFDPLAIIELTEA